MCVPLSVECTGLLAWWVWRQVVIYPQLVARMFPSELVSEQLLQFGCDTHHGLSISQANPGKWKYN